ncbi:hypothetical protein F751_0356 [Auxenochlorella protothecoides]|uniref:Uncharacterized protein n=1 Tax=Auxenochlorella protothecoides TaxID=3075 RepID=A0A087SB94_AUXPR|nr:hypothetical protein F751_0356 [Auxenochlorella protothecoides]KFM22998.1 hypothetical protein F751_0356 [Auxenochlorella protothecoides]RMZ57232.1 hypothetical protein APUTEX25_004066 [Auxenochlorella protothecoides]|eukprot:RMZ57232.1 hypothetical protein APUTEX25_004066 [Auxenochlorella protothecoides]
MQEAAQLEALRQHLLMQKAQLEELQRMKDQFAEHERAQLKAMLGGMLAQQRQDHAVGVERMFRLPAGVILKGRVRVRLAARLALRTERAPVLVPRAALSRNV